jgi:alpha-mannosidase
MGTPFTIYVIQSAHTDIGYTHPQEQIALMYLEHYDRVLELCRQTADAPEAQRFKWVCETFWQVRHYLSQRPEREEEFLQRVRSGQIELMANYLHFTDLIDADAYARSLRLAVDYCRRHQLPLRCAMHCDINGWPWAMADLLAELEIPYFCSQIHVDSATDPLGRRGSVHYHWLREWGDAFRPDVPIRVPQAFWWQGPKGGKVLHWLNEHYMLGNVLGVSSPHPFGADKTRYFLETDPLTADDLFAIAMREVPMYLERLRAEGYADTKMLLSTGGFYVDNAPPDQRWCEVIARWNAEHSDVRMRTATLSEWFEALQADGPRDWPTRQVAWPDHWSHGLGSLTARVAQARRTQRRRPAAVEVVTQSGSKQAASYLEMALEQERLALEHTFDAWCTTARPAATGNAFQQAAKELTFHRAELYLDEAIGAALRPREEQGVRIRGNFSPLLHAHVAAPGTYVLHFDAGDRRLDPAKHILLDQQGQEVPFQLDHTGLPQFVATFLAAERGLQRFQLAERASAASNQGSVSTLLSTAAWRLTVDQGTGGLSSLRELQSGREWVDAQSPYRFGQLVHEAVVHPAGREAVANRARLIALDAASEELRKAWAGGPVVEHTTMRAIAEPQQSQGPVFDEIVVLAEGDRHGRARIAWRAYHALPLIELVLDWDKHWSDLPEAAYVAFPFAANGARLEFETGGGFFQPGSHEAGGQLAGTCSSYYTIQRAARISGAQGSLLWLPLDAPLVMPNAIDYARWETEPWQWNGLIASMPVNHYWHTNFPTSQRGPLRLRYRLIAPPQGADTEASIQAAQPVDALGWR